MLKTTFEMQPIIDKYACPPLWGMVLRGSPVDQFLREGGRPEDLFARGSCILKGSGSTRAALVQMGASHEIFIKEYHFKNLLHSLKPLFGGHRARIVWDISRYLIRKGVPVPRPIGYLVDRRGPFCMRGYFFSESMAECSHLGRVARASAQSNALTEFCELVELIATQVAFLHGSAVTHGDLKWSNILVHKCSERIWFVDLDSARICRHRPTPGQAAPDLARFALSALQYGIDAFAVEHFMDRYSLERGIPRKYIDPPFQDMLKRLRRQHRL